MFLYFIFFVFFFFFFQAEDGIRDVAVTGVQTCALPISFNVSRLPTLLSLALTKFPVTSIVVSRLRTTTLTSRSEEHTSELQSRLHLVCRLLLEKKKTTHFCISLSSTMISVFYSVFQRKA